MASDAPPLLLLILFAARRSLDTARSNARAYTFNTGEWCDVALIFIWSCLSLVAYISSLRWRPLNFGGTVFVVRYDSHVSSCVSVWIVFVCVWRDVCVCAPRICLVLMCRCGVCAVVWQAGIAVSVPEASRLSHLRVVQRAMFVCCIRSRFYYGIDDVW